MSLTLHACPNILVPQDICVIDLPPFFSLCLSRDFTAKIGGYVLADWSHILFRTRYGTKVVIKSERLAKDHIEPYNPNPINAAPVVADTNCVIFADSELAAARELQAKVIPDVFLHEWAVENVLDSPEDLIQDAGMGNYVILEPDIEIPNL